MIRINNLYCKTYYNRRYCICTIQAPGLRNDTEIIHKWRPSWSHFRIIILYYCIIIMVQNLWRAEKLWKQKVRYLSSLKERYLTTNPKSYPGKEEEISHELLYSSQYLFQGTLKTKRHKKPQPFALQILATNSTTWSNNSFLLYTVYVLKSENITAFFFFLRTRFVTPFYIIYYFT